MTVRRDNCAPLLATGNRVSGRARAAAHPPKAFVVRGSNNGSSWTDIKSFSGVTGWVNQTAKIFSLYE